MDVEVPRSPQETGKSPVQVQGQVVGSLESTDGSILFNS